MAKRKHRAEQPGLLQVLVPITLVIEKKSVDSDVKHALYVYI